MGINLTALKILVVVMSILIVIGIAIIVTTIAKRSVSLQEGFKKLPPQLREKVVSDGHVTIPITDTIKSILSSDSYLYVWTDNDEVIIIDPSQGKVINRISFSKVSTSQ